MKTPKFNFQWISIYNSELETQSKVTQNFFLISRPISNGVETIQNFVRWITQFRDFLFNLSFYIWKFLNHCIWNYVYIITAFLVTHRLFDLIRGLVLSLELLFYRRLVIHFWYLLLFFRNIKFKRLNSTFFVLSYKSDSGKCRFGNICAPFFTTGL